MPESVVYNCDCLEYLGTLPDNAFELAVVDPPYGAGFTEGGGCQGWFSKYHQNTDDCSQIVNVEREREAKGSDATAEIDGTDTTLTSCGNSSTGTTTIPEIKSRKRKKLSRGTLRRGRNILKSFSASRAIRSSGAETILLCRRPDAF